MVWFLGQPLKWDSVPKLRTISESRADELGNFSVFLVMICLEEALFLPVLAF